jgi:hypothetical protein
MACGDRCKLLLIVVLCAQASTDVVPALCSLCSALLCSAHVDRRRQKKGLRQRKTTQATTPTSKPTGEDTILLAQRVFLSIHPLIVCVGVSRLGGRTR